MSALPVKKIGEIAKAKGGKRLPKGMGVQDEETRHPYLRVVDFRPDGIDRSNIKFISDEAFEYVSRYTITGDDIYVSIAGTIGRVGIVPDDLSGANLTENAAKVTEISADVDRRYLLQFFRSAAGQSALQAKAGGTSQPKLALFRIEEIEFPCPPLREQKAIAEILSAYDHLIESNRRRMALLEQAARQLYREWFVCLRFPGHEHTRITNGVPQGWERRRIGDVADCVGGGTPSTSESNYWEDGDVTWVTPTDVTRNAHFVLLDSEKKITSAGLRDSSAKLVPPHAVLMTSRASVGFFAVAGREVCTNQGFISIVPREPVLWPYFLFHLSERVEEIRAMGSGSTYPEVSRGKFRELEVLLPKHSLAIVFCEQAEDLLRQIRILKQQNERLRAARDLLLPRLMSGEIAV